MQLMTVIYEPSTCPTTGPAHTSGIEASSPTDLNDRYELKGIPVTRHPVVQKVTHELSEDYLPRSVL